MAVIALGWAGNPVSAAPTAVTPAASPKPSTPAPAAQPPAPAAAPKAPAPGPAPAAQPPAPATAPKAPASGPASVAPVVAPAQKEEPKQAPYSYAPRGRRDPFTPLIVREEKKAASAAAKSPLQRYNISDFKFTGVVWGGLGFNAILEAPDGKGYFIRVGSVVGPNGGVVKKITQNSLLIEEKYKTFGGETQRKEIVVELRKRQE